MDNFNTRVLIVDDQESIYIDFQEMLGVKRRKRRSDELLDAFVPVDDKDKKLPEAPVYELSYASSGKEAYNMVKAADEANRPFAVAYVDIRMPPGMDGVETIRRIRRFEKNLEIVIMTAYTDKPLPEIVTNMELLHKLLYIRKPVAREEIQQITRSLVEKWNLEQEASTQRQQLATSHQRLQTVLDASGDAIGMFDSDARLRYANRQYRELFDLSKNELGQLPPEEIAARVEARLREVKHPQAEYLTRVGDVEAILEERGTAPSSEPRLFCRSTALLKDSEDGNTGRVVSYRDLSKEAQIQRMKTEISSLRHQLKSSYSFQGIVGKSSAMQRVYENIQLAAEENITVLVQGESGTGKELIAKSIHYNGSRKNGPFVPINCAAIPESLIESELFGHERGAFTGATNRRIGKFEEADGGTIFLDEIGDMPPSLQAKLLRVLQDRQIQRIGSAAYINSDFRVIAATNRDLEANVTAGHFREDLFYRIAVFPIVIPPLRERRADIPLLANHFLQKYARNSRDYIGSIAPDALSALMQYHFPGNVREMENIIESAVLLETSNVLQAGNLSPQIAPDSPSAITLDNPPNPGVILPLDQLEHKAILHALKVTDNNVTRAAHALGVDRSTLHRKMKNYRIHG